MPQKFDAKVLVVEDYPVNQELTREMLEMLGCTVDIAENGGEALEMVQDRQYELIFMDIQMPDMDGYDCTREIRKLEKGDQRIPIVALTANALQGDREKCLAAGMDEYISKPFRLVDLESIITKFIKPKEGV